MAETTGVVHLPTNEAMTPLWPDDLLNTGQPIDQPTIDIVPVQCSACLRHSTVTTRWDDAPARCRARLIATLRSVEERLPDHPCPHCAGRVEVLRDWLMLLDLDQRDRLKRTADAFA